MGAEDTSRHCKAAPKFLLAEMQQNTTAYKRFICEARSAAAPGHPYIYHIDGVAKSDGQSVKE